MTTDEALDAVLADIEAMTPDQLRAEMLRHRDGDIAVARREIRQFLVDFCAHQSGEGPIDTHSPASV